MSSQFQTTDANDKLARAINHDARTNPSSPYAGKYVGIVRGKVVAVGDDLDSVAEALHEAEPDRHERYLLEASADYDTPCEIW